MKKLFIGSMVIILSFVLSGCSCKHEYDEGKITKEATCKEEGIKTSVCKLCGEEKTEPLSLAEHTYDTGKVTKKSTCTEEGIKTSVCKLCGEEKTEPLSLAEHTYDSGKVAKESTCTEEGEKTLTCKICGNEKVETIKIKDHDYEEKITKEATFKEEGIKTFICKDCEDSYTEAIPVRDDKVVLTVEDKINFEKDTSAWRFNSFVEFVCKIENMTDKDIKGIEGELIINDLFGKLILTVGWDITGEDIPANDFIIQKGYGLEINEFMDTNVKL